MLADFFKAEYDGQRQQNQSARSEKELTRQGHITFTGLLVKDYLNDLAILEREESSISYELTEKRESHL